MTIYLSDLRLLVYFSRQGKNEPCLVFLPLEYLLQLSNQHIHFFLLFLSYENLPHVPETVNEKKSNEFERAYKN